MNAGTRKAPFFAETNPEHKIKAFRFVEVDPADLSATYSATDANAVTVSGAEAEYNHTVSYLPLGYMGEEVKVELAGTVSKGDGLSSDSDGKAVEETTEADILAQAGEDGVAGDFIVARLFKL